MGQKLGQHFLADQQILQRIVDEISDLVDKSGVEELWEIGPGQGALTKEIFALAPVFRCFEKDETMKKYLGQFLQEGQIVRGDVLEDGNTETVKNGNMVVVGNLPYYITSPILRKFFVENVSPLGGVFLIQKEVADKIKTDAKKKSYLWWLLNNGYEVEYLFTVSPEAFDPPPKVDSAVVQLRRRETRKLNSEEYEQMLGFLDVVSPYKRKTLGKIQKMIVKKGRELSLPERLLGARLEELGWEEIQEIVKFNGV